MEWSQIFSLPYLGHPGYPFSLVIDAPAHAAPLLVYFRDPFLLLLVAIDSLGPLIRCTCQPSSILNIL